MTYYLSQVVMAKKKRRMKRFLATQDELIKKNIEHTVKPDTMQILICIREGQWVWYNAGAANWDTQDGRQLYGSLSHFLSWHARHTKPLTHIEEKGEAP